MQLASRRQNVARPKAMTLIRPPMLATSAWHRAQDAASATEGGGNHFHYSALFFCNTRHQRISPEDGMPKLGTVVLTGASGKKYELSVYPRADLFKHLGAVYALAKRIPHADSGDYTWIYVGETGDL